MGRCLYARDPRGETSACILVLALVATFVENPVCVEKCSLRVELHGKTIDLNPVCVRLGLAREKNGLAWF